MTDRVALSMIAATISNYSPEIRADLVHGLEYLTGYTTTPLSIDERRNLDALLDVLSEEPRYAAFREAS